MSAKNIQSHNYSVLRAQGIKRSIMGSALLAGLASTALLYPQAALAQDAVPASNNEHLSISAGAVPAGTIPVLVKSVGGGQVSLAKNPVLPDVEPKVRKLESTFLDSDFTHCRDG